MLLTITLRNENQKIRQELFNNIKNRNRFNIGNRAKAIKYAIKNANPWSILIAGKGHENANL